MIDLHTHILPGVDDGSTSYDSSIAMLKGLESEGITDVFLTPHYIPETNQTSRKFDNLKIFNLLKAKSVHEGIKLNLHLGNEVYLSDDIVELIKHGDVSTLGNSEYVLIELPMSGEYEDYLCVLTELVGNGYKVVLAHPERYLSFQKDYELIVALAQGDILLQCNLGSLTGQYGKKARKIVKKLAKDDLIFCFGTDIHHERDYSEIAKAKSRLKKIYTEERLDQILDKNPRQIIESMLK